MAADELLPRVHVYELSERMREEFRILIGEVFRGVLAELENGPTGVLRGHEAARYLGLGRSRFYALLKEDPELMAASYTVGKARCWPVAALESWVQARQAEVGK